MLEYFADDRFRFEELGFEEVHRKTSTRSSSVMSRSESSTSKLCVSGLYRCSDEKLGSVAEENTLTNRGWKVTIGLHCYVT